MLGNAVIMVDDATYNFILQNNAPDIAHADGLGFSGIRDRAGWADVYYRDDAGQANAPNPLCQLSLFFGQLQPEMCVTSPSCL
jgi:hypothetical protein